MVHIVFVHPDLGIGGAERLVIDSALALQTKGHEVSFVTAHHDHSHCFPETKDGQLNVTCIGDWLPRSFLNKFYAFWAYVRMIYISLYLAFFSAIQFDVIFVDQVSACIPFLALKKTSIIYYCHYPDMLLTDRKSFLKKMYRSVLDYIEEKSTGMADVILVNSNFTAGVFKSTFPSIKYTPTVVYPTINIEVSKHSLSLIDLNIPITKHIFLSVNRYERKKNLSLAVQAFKNLTSKLTTKEIDETHLVIAGGYDHRVVENVQYYTELQELTTTLCLENYVTFLKSPLNDVKYALLRHCTCLLYTPDKEHFGIVPLEAMGVGTPVIAVNSGGPTETVVEGKTGFLCEQTPNAFASKMQLFLTSDLKAKMSDACIQRVREHFSFQTFAENLDAIVQETLHKCHTKDS